MAKVDESRGRRRHSAGAKCLSFVLAASMVFGPLATALPESRDREVASYLRQLQLLGHFARDVRDAIDRSRFDTDALLDTLDFEADQIIAFVRDAIHFEQYPGTLRGPQGTLMSRAGNTIDQALLLAKLLRDAGYDARIVRGSLNGEQASLLLSQMQQPMAPMPPVGDVEKAMAAYVKHGLIDRGNAEARTSLNSVFSADGLLADEVVSRQAESATAQIERELRAAGIAFEGTRGREMLLAEASDYFWVQVRESAAQPWKDVHPALTQQEPFAGVKPAETFADSIPEAFQHRLRVQFFLERSIGGSLESVAISEPWERPIANLLDTPITVGVLPDTLFASTNHGFDVESALAKASYFAPFMNGSMAPGASFFDAHGTLIDPMAMASPAASIMATLQEAFLGAAKDLGADQLPVMTAQWIEFTLIAPMQDDQVYRRMTIDLLGPAARALKTLPEKTESVSTQDLAPMTQHQTVMVNAGRIPRGMVMDRSLERFSGSIPLLEAVTRSLLVPEEPNNLALALRNVPQSWPGHLGLFSAFDYAETLANERHIYRSGPALVIHRSGLSVGGGALEGIDIVTNPRRAIPSRGTVGHDPSALVAAGAWESQLEGTALHETSEVVNTATIFSEAKRRGIPLVLIKPDDQSELNISADTMEYVKADLDRGFAVIAPASDEGLGRFGWWRVNLMTGETLGMMDDGRGSAITEALITHQSAISQAFLVVGLIGCLKEAHVSGHQAGGPDRAACCVVSNFALYGVGMIGGVVGGIGFQSGAEGLLQASKAYLAYASVLWDSLSSLLSICEGLLAGIENLHPRTVDGGAFGAVLEGHSREEPRRLALVN